jgi:predicted dienelactone hydrolase
MPTTGPEVPNSGRKRSGLIRRLITSFLAVMLLGAVGIAVLVGLLLLDHNRETTLPKPTGPFAVGRATYVWDDAAHADPMAPPPGAKRELLAWIWYPAAPQQPSQTFDDYLPAPWRTALDRQRGPVITNFLTRDLSRVRAHSIRDARAAPQQRAYPVVFMRAGLAALTTDYTSLAEDLASHGYVVVGFDAPYRSWIVVLPDGRVIARAPQNNADLLSGPEREQLAAKLVQTWAADTRFALDQLERLNASDPSGRFLGRLDLQRVGLFGHSLGGAASLQVCHDDSRCKAGIDIDGAPLGSVVAQGVTQPFMFLLSAQVESSDVESSKVKADIKSIYDRLPAQGRLNVEIRGANHYLFSDEGAMLKTRVIAGPLRMSGILGIDGPRQLAVTAYCVRSFFDTYLKNASVSPLRIWSPLYPEIRMLE